MGSHCNLIVAMGNTIEMVGIAAEANPSQKFMITDWVPDQPLENVWTQTYAIDQAAFLAGYLAASVTKTGKVGIFGGVDTPPVTDFMDGFTLGVEYYNRKNGTSVQVLGWDVGRHEGLFTGSFCCTTEGRQMTKKLLDEGADIIVPVAGQSIGWGAGAEIKEHGDAFLIGVDTDWTETFPEFTSILLTSIEKNYAVSVTLVAKSIVDNNFAGGVHVGSLSDAQVGISTFHDLDGLISSKVKTDLEQIRADIIAGKIKTRP
jgi:basic membrane protein A